MRLPRATGAYGQARRHQAPRRVLVVVIGIGAVDVVAAVPRDADRADDLVLVALGGSLYRFGFDIGQLWGERAARSGEIERHRVTFEKNRSATAAKGSRRVNAAFPISDI